MVKVPTISAIKRRAFVGATTYLLCPSVAVRTLDTVVLSLRATVFQT